MSISIDQKSKLIKKFEITSANIHDSRVLEELCESKEPLFDDSAFRNKTLTDLDKRINQSISRIRYRVEHVFGVIKNTMKGSHFRGIGLARTKTNVILTNLLYNICRFEQIQRLGLKTWGSIP